jgi:histidinol-phosphate aminotransferase
MTTVAGNSGEAMPKLSVKPSPTVAGTVRYSVPQPLHKVELRLDGNEGPFPDPSISEAFTANTAALARNYPSAKELESVIAARLDVDPARVLVTAGGDDAILRACVSVLAPGRKLLLPVPTFEMFGRFCKLAGGETVTLPWPSGPYPLASVLAGIDDDAAMIAVVSPNNPTGATANAGALRSISAAARSALVLADLAYGEFADDDLMAVALSLPNAVAVRSMSKAWGLAGLRVGYAAGPEEIIGWMRSVGSPYAVSGPSLAMAGHWIENGRDSVAAFVARVREERTVLARVLSVLGAVPIPSQANFVLARFKDAGAVWDGLAGEGVAVRIFPGNAMLDGCLRITCPGNERDFKRLVAALYRVMNRNR